MNPPGLGAPRAWTVTEGHAPASELQRDSVALVAGPAPARRAIRILSPTPPCVVLGSTEGPRRVDPVRLEAAGWDVIRRRSGGSAVVVGTGEVLWVDVVVPAPDPLWVPDVARAGWWLGSIWAEALHSAGWREVEMWRGGLRRREWSDRVCFAGLGPGEVTIGGRKVVGISQRRTRLGALFQCGILARWAPGELLGVLDLSDAERRSAGVALAEVAVGIGPSAAAAALRSFVEAVAAQP